MSFLFGDNMLRPRLFLARRVKFAYIVVYQDGVIGCFRSVNIGFDCIMNFMVFKSILKSNFKSNLK
jgi:hypothetical protein